MKKFTEKNTFNIKSIFPKYHLRIILGGLLVLIMSFWTVFPLTNDGYIPIHDDTQIGRVIAMGKALREGQFPVRWVSDLGYGYGYPLFNFYGPLPYYAGGILYSLGIHPIICTKIMMIFGLLLSGLLMYLVAVKWFGIIGAIFAGILVMYAPYHAVDLYVRGAIGELWAIAFLPLVFFGIISIIVRPGLIFRDILLPGIGLAMVILSHTILGFVTVSFYLFFLVIKIIHLLLTPTNHKYKQTFHLFSGLLFGLLISAFFWMPALYEMSYTSVSGQIGGGADYKNHFVCFSQLWTSIWGYGGSAPGCLDGMSFTIGKFHIIAAFISIIYLGISLYRQKYLGRNEKVAIQTINIIAIYSLLVTLISVFFMLPLSKFLWDILPGFSYIQYPWRFLSIVVISISIFSACLISRFQTNKQIQYITFLFLIVIIGFNKKWFVPQYIYKIPDSQLENILELRYRISKISDEYLPSDFIRPKNESDINNNPVIAVKDVYSQKLVDTSTYFLVLVSSNKDTEVGIRKVFFPGWKYRLDRKEIQPIIRNGLPYIRISKGEHKVELTFSDTPIRLISNIISLLVIILYIWYYDQKADL